MTHGLDDDPPTSRAKPASANTDDVATRTESRAVSAPPRADRPGDSVIRAAVDAGAFPGLALPGVDDNPVDTPTTTPALPRPVTRIGRFAVLRKLGEGGMGVVYAGYDEELDRKIAIKLIRSRSHGSHARARLLREAQGLARLSHPNVVQIHEIGEHDGAVFVAMEFIRGVTLREWLGSPEPSEREAEHASQARPWRERLAMLLQAGRGLEAAHQAGMVHRDFKPDNAMVGTDGRLRVLDFGLVRSLGQPELHDAPTDRPISSEGDAPSDLLRVHSDDDDTSAQPLGPSLTAAGSLLGTPAYMAPEQMLGRAAGPAADQFAFCVTAFEGLYGRRPFAGRTLHELTASVLEGKVAAIPKSTDVPSRLYDALVRGLAVDPEQRWPTLGALLAVLEQQLAPEVRRRGWLLLGGALLLGAAGISAALLGRDRAEPCAIDPSALAGAWDDEQRARVRASFAGTSLGSAGVAAATVEAELDGWADRWVDGRRDACVATRVEGTASASMLDRRVGCLDRQRYELLAIVERLATADDQVVARAPELLAGLPAIEACSAARVDAEHTLPEDSAQRAAILDGFEAVARGRAMLNLGTFDQLDDLLVTSLEPKVEHLPLELAWSVLRAERALTSDDYAVGIPALLDAARRGQVAGLDDFSTSVRVKVAEDAAGRWGKPELETWLLDEAEVAVARANVPNDPRHVALLRARGLLLDQRGEHDRALSLFREALAAADGHDGDLPDPLLAAMRRNVASSLAQLRQFEDARAEYASARTFLVERWTQRSPLVAELEYNMGILASDQGRLDEAREHFLLAREIFGDALGPESPRVALIDFAQAKLDLGQGHLDAAQRRVERALPVFEAAFGDRRELTADAHSALGVLRFYADDLEGSLVAYRRALEIYTSLLGPDHEQVALTHSNIGESLAGLGRHREAMQAYAQSLRSIERTMSAEHPVTALPLKGRGLSALAVGDHEVAIDDLEQALRLHERSGDEPIELAETRLGLAQALAARDVDDPRIIDLLAAAKRDFIALGLDERVRAVEQASRR
ncbi:MAG: serine/threonine-protein kinase [Myxococcota bacterium]